MLKKISIILSLLIASVNCISQQQQQITGIDNVGNNDIQVFNCLNKREDSYYRQFVVPIESDNVSVNNGMQLTITAAFIGYHNYSIRLEDLNPQLPSESLRVCNEEQTK